MLSMIQWTTPLMLAGMGLLSLPLIAHFMYKRSRRRIVVPTLKFFQQAASQQNHLMKLKRLLLLLLRCLAVALIVLAFARPLWQASSAPVTDDSIAMAIVIDASLSTSQSVGNSNAFQSFIASAERALNQLEPSRDLATIVIAGRTANPLVSKLSFNLPLLKSQLASLKYGYEAADLEGALREAARQLASHEGRKMLVVISDMQATNWADLLADRRSRWELPAGVEVRFVDSKLEGDSNIALSKPTCMPADPVSGQKIQLSVQVTNFSSEIKQIPVSLSVAGGEAQTQNIRIDGRSNAVASFIFTYQDSSTSEFTFSIPSDKLAADNTAFLATRPGINTPIIVISDDPPSEVGTTSFFMERALLPFNDVKDRFSVTQIASDQVVDTALAQCRIAIVGYVANLNGEAIEELVSFVRRGGHLIYLCGEGRVAEQIRRIEASTNETFFPFTLERIIKYERFDTAPFIASGKWRSRWLREFDLRSQIALRQIRFAKAWSTSAATEDADVILTYSNHDPAVAVRTFGLGQVILANLSPSIEFSEFGTYGSFVVLVQLLVKQLADNDDLESQLVGKSLMFAPPLNDINTRELAVTDPKGSELASLQTSSKGAKTLLVEATKLPGFYRMQSNLETLQIIAVNIDPQESDLRRIDPKQLVDLGQARLSVAESDDFSVTLVDRGTPLWGWLAAIAMVALALESFLVGWWKR